MNFPRHEVTLGTMPNRSQDLVVETESPQAATWQQLLIAHVLRLFAASQTVYVVVLHAAWIMLVLLLLAMTSGTAGGDGIEAAARAVMNAFRWLGGVDADGRGGMDGVMAVWAKLAVVVWLVGLAIAPLRGPRRRWSILKTLLVSTGIALAGFGLAMALLEPVSKGSSAWFVASMTIATFLCTAWMVAVARGVEWLIPRIGRRPNAILQ